jgi:hypothetical protein
MAVNLGVAVSHLDKSPKLHLGVGHANRSKADLAIGIWIAIAIEWLNLSGNGNACTFMICWSLI